MACLSAPQVFVRPIDRRREADDAKAKFVHSDGDHLTLLNVYHSWKVACEGPAGMSDHSMKRWCHENYLNFR